MPAAAVNMERAPRLTEVPATWTASDPSLPLSGRVARLLSRPTISSRETPLECSRRLPAVAARAFRDGDPQALLDFHRSLFLLYEASLAHPLSHAAQQENEEWFWSLRSRLESVWYREEYRRIESQIPADEVLRSPERLGRWFEEQAARADEVADALARYLEDAATVADLRAFIRTDGCLNFRFYDALALAQGHFAESIKTEISRHMWDEAGQGDMAASHTALFGRALQAAGVEPDDLTDWEDWRPVAGFNLYFLLGRNRRHFFKSLGSLAMPELFDALRDRSVVTGMKRLGLDTQGDYLYYAAHMSADEEHGPSWLENVVLQAARVEPQAPRELAVGGLLRMRSMRQFNGYLASILNLPSS